MAYKEWGLVMVRVRLQRLSLGRVTRFHGFYVKMLKILK